MKPGAKAGLTTETDVGAVEAETGTEGDVGTGAAGGAEIGKDSVEAAIEVSVGAIFGTDRVAEAGRTRGGRDAKSGIEFKVGTGIVETGVGAEARTGIGIVEAYVGGAVFGFVGTASCRAAFEGGGRCRSAPFSRVGKGGRPEVC